MTMASILIVDDDRFLHKVLGQILEVGGHQVSGHAHNGSEAIERFVELDPKPDLILMDHRMPIMNGAIATREIIEIDPSARILFISADQTVKSEAIESGALDFLTKPIRSAVLFSAIDKHTDA
jgi:two-component system chemotaxis response regulator CheY